ncbi:hypothetical protein F4810DRAFT_700426 [Camillea tinctor]|nr:hypothetical protein F4810DRAFT_700426 [Camillea tinctor]
MSMDLRNLSNEDVVRLTKILCRRPEYGIAIPSAKWLRRQEDRIVGKHHSHLPKPLLRPTNPLRRLAQRLVDSVDPLLADPQAVLCPTHYPLNPWLLRRAFMALVYEVTVHSDALRSWAGLGQVPGLGRLVARLDAVNALWTPPELYRGFYGGGAPFKGHLVHVRSGCEACILAAAGANAQVLADLRAVVGDRKERRMQHRERKGGGKGKGREKEPRIARVVEAWIDHLGPERAAACREWSEETLAELRAVREQVRRHRGEQKRAHDSQRRNKKPVYTELQIKRRGGGGDRLSAVPTDAKRKRRTRNGIPVALAVGGGPQVADAGARSVFRPDSEVGGFSRVGARASNAAPTRSFVQRFEREMAIEEEHAQCDEEDYDCEDEYDDDEYEADGDAEQERDFAQEERSRTKVRDWYATRLDGGADDAQSALSTMHPAFQPYAAPSAVPPALDLDGGLRKDRDPRSGLGDTWTEATAYTVDPSTVAPAPPVPRVPSRYQAQTQPQQEEKGPVNWPAPPRQGEPTGAGMGLGKGRKYLFPDSEAGSQLTATQRQYLRDRRGLREFARPEDNPFARREHVPPSRSSTAPRSTTTAAARSSSRTTGPSPSSHRTAPSLSRSHGNTLASSSVQEPGEEADRVSRVGSIWGIRTMGMDSEVDPDAVRPDDSVSNVYARRPADRSEVTSLGGLVRRAGGGGK